MISKIKLPPWTKKFLLTTALMLVLMAGLVVLIYHLVYAQKIYPFVRVGPVELSNLTKTEVVKRLEQATPQTLPSIELVFGNHSWPIDLNSLMIVYDSPLTAEAAYSLGRKGTTWEKAKQKWQLWWQGRSLGLKFSLDETKFNQAVETVTAEIEEAPITPRLELQKNGQVQLIQGRNGRLVKKDELIKLWQQRLGQLDFSPIEIKAAIVMFNQTSQELEQARIRGEKIKDRVIKLPYDGGQEEIKGQILLDLIKIGGDWDEEKIASWSLRLAQKIDRPAQNAILRFSGNRVVEFKPALTGWELDQEKTNEQLKAGLLSLETGEEKTVTVKSVIRTTEPKIKTESVNDLGIKTLIGKGESTFHGSIASREHNIALTAAKLNGVLISPGETFSFNQAVGDVSAATGYKSAYIIKDGKTILGDGGGVCQVSTTMFRAALDAGLPILERTAHSYRVSYYEQNAPPGIDATVYEPSPDLKFKNDTPGYILIQARANTSTNYLVIELYGTSDGRQATISNTRLWDQVPPPPDQYLDDPSLTLGTVKQIDWKAWGAKAAFDWKVVRNGEVLQEKTFYSNYQPWQAVFLRGTKP
jgi:vancomycin resistance protein YoaR